MQFPTHIVAVGGITKNDLGEVLLVKTGRGLWTYPGGQVENGENLEDALIRETKEESGIDIVVTKLIGVYSNTCSYPGYNGYETVPTKLMLDFVCKAIGGTLGTSEETPESKWVKETEVLEYITAPNLVDRFNAYLEQETSVRYLEYATKPSYDLKLKREI